MIINDSVYGEVKFDGFLEQIIATPSIQRLKNIHQGGAMFLAYPNIKTPRFEHSLGVCHLIEILGGSDREQVAGLLHDLSHTAFSHVVDYILENKDEDFHEQHKLRFLSNKDLSKTLYSLGFEPEDFLEDEQFPLLEAEHPALCADRIDYTLRDLIAWGKMSQQEAKQFIDSLVVVEKEIVVNSLFWGQWFKNSYEYLNKHFFRDPKNIVANELFAQLLTRALSMDIIQIEDFFEDDNYVIGKINNCAILKDSFKSIAMQLESGINQANNIEYKQRHVDPLILENKRVVKLSSLVN